MPPKVKNVVDVSTLKKSKAIAPSLEVPSPVLALIPSLSLDFVLALQTLVEPSMCFSPLPKKDKRQAPEVSTLIPSIAPEH